MHTVRDPHQCILFMTHANAHCSCPHQCTLFMTLINAYCSWPISMHTVHDPYRCIMKQKRWNEVEGSLNKTQFPAAGAAWKATFVLLIGFKKGLLDTELTFVLLIGFKRGLLDTELTFVLLIGFKKGLLDTELPSRNKVPNLLPSSIQFNSIQFNSVQFNSKNFNYPTRGSFVVVMAGS